MQHASKETENMAMTSSRADSAGQNHEGQNHPMQSWVMILPLMIVPFLFPNAFWNRLLLHRPRRLLVLQFRLKVLPGLRDRLQKHGHLRSTQKHARDNHCLGIEACDE